MQPHNVRGPRPSVIDLEKVLYVIQKRDEETGAWRVEGMAVMGRTEAYKVLNVTKEADPGSTYRTVQKTSADDYRQGWREAIEFASDDPEGFLRHLREYDMKYPPVEEEAPASQPPDTKLRAL